MMSTSGNTFNILDLPWEDILFKHILPLLHLQTLFQLRAVNKLYLECLTVYFRHMQVVDFTWAGPRFNSPTFHLITHENNVLRSLILRNAKDWLHDKFLIPVLDANVRLRKVDFTNCTSVTNASIEKLALSCKSNLNDLCLRECHWLSSNGLLVLARNCPELKRLDITGCWQVNDAALGQLAELCKQLQYLNVSKIYGLTDQSLRAVACNSCQLQHLNIQGCWRITDDAVRLLTDQCKQLKMLQVRECRDVTLYSIARLQARGVHVDVPVNRYQLNPELSKYLKKLSLQTDQ